MMNRQEFEASIQQFTQKYHNHVYPLMEHELEWLWFIHSNPWILLLAPRGHGKSTIMVIYVSWLICNDTGIRILIASHKEELADVFARQIQMVMEDPRAQEEFGIEIGRPWRVGKAFFAGAPQPFMTTVAKQAGMTGWRGDIVIFDDLLTEENQATEKRRRKLENWIWGEVMPALDPGDKQKIIIVGTRKNLDDWYSQIMKTSDFVHRIYKIYENDDPTQALWPERFTPEYIAKLKRTNPPRFFAREYLNSPIVEEGLYLEREWIKHYTELPPKHCLNTYMGVDLSGGSTEERATSLAIAVIAQDTRPEFGHIYVLELFKAKLSLGKQFEKIQQLFEKWKPLSVNVEACLYNQQFAQQVIQRIPNAYPIDYIHSRLRGTSETSKELRIKNYIGLMFEEGRVLMRDPAYDYQVRAFIEEEYVQFPDKTGDTDLLDALTLAVDLCEFVISPDETPFMTW